MRPIVLVALLGCAGRAPEAEMPATPDETFTATLEVDAEPSAKRFQGVWLTRDDGERWVVAYRPWTCWTPFDGQRVAVTGARYEPEGQAIGATHFRVETLRVEDPSASGTLVSVGPESEWTGAFATRAGEPGSKQEGSTWVVFESAGAGALEVWNPQVADGHTGQVSIRGRELERSPFAAHSGGRVVWVASVDGVTRGP